MTEGRKGEREREVEQARRRGGFETRKRRHSSQSVKTSNLLKRWARGDVSLQQLHSDLADNVGKCIIPFDELPPWAIENDGESDSSEED